MSPSAKVWLVPPPKPVLHLIVPAPGQEDAFKDHFNDLRAQQASSTPVLAWRVDCSDLLLLNDADLNVTLLQALTAGRRVTVWHGERPWSPWELAARLGRAVYARHGEQILWAQLPSLGKNTAAHTLDELVRQIDTPDEAELRALVSSHDKQVPASELLWDLPAQQVEQGRAACQAWFERHLTPRLALEASDARAWKEDNLHQIQGLSNPSGSNNGEATELRPWQSDLMWESEHWLEAASAGSQVGTDRSAVNDQRIALHASSLKATKVPPEVRQAVLRPVGSGDQWETDQLNVGTTAKAPNAVAAGAAMVRISRQPADPSSLFGITVSLPSHPEAAGKALGWCLWLHPLNRLPIPLEFRREPLQPQSLAWPAAHPPSDPLWDDIVGGGLSLEALG